MNRETLKFVYRMRAVIYIAMFVAIAMLQVVNWTYADSFPFDIHESDDSSEYWPPNIVPHPELPERGREEN